MNINFQRLALTGPEFLQVITMPQFGDILGENGQVIIPSDETEDWQVMDDVPHRRLIIELLGNKNLLKRRDNTCKIIRGPLGSLSARYIETEKVYIAAENCQQELYQGAFRDWESRSDVFREKALELLLKIFGTDIFSNKWFGYTGRVANATWSVNKFDGIWHHFAKYITAGTIPTGQTVDLGDAATFTDQEAYESLVAMVEAQDPIMENTDDDDKAFYVTKKWARKAWAYLKTIGQVTPAEAASPVPNNLFIQGIQVKTKKWDPVLNAIMGAQAYAGVLTLKGNFIYATDSRYGKGPNNDGPALQAWYDIDDDVTRWEMHHKGGTELALAQASVVATSTGVLAAL